MVSFIFYYFILFCGARLRHGIKTPPPHNRLDHLLEVHHHLLPLSRILFNLERQTAAQLSLAQVMVIVKDQVSIATMYGEREEA